MGDGLQAEGSIAGLRKTPGCSASDVIDPSRCGRWSTPRVQRGRAQDDGMVVSRNAQSIAELGVRAFRWRDLAGARSGTRSRRGFAAEAAAPRLRHAVRL